MGCFLVSLKCTLFLIWMHIRLTYETIPFERNPLLKYPSHRSFLLTESLRSNMIQKYGGYIKYVCFNSCIHKLSKCELFMSICNKSMLINNIFILPCMWLIYVYMQHKINDFASQPNSCVSFGKSYLFCV